MFRRATNRYLSTVLSSNRPHTLAVGYGFMGQRLVPAFTANPNNTTVVDPFLSQIPPEVKVPGVNYRDSCPGVLAQNATFVLAIKPQDAEAYFNKTRLSFNKSHLIVSTLAGTPPRILEAYLKAGGFDRVPVVSMMPNLLLGSPGAVAGILGGEHATKQDIQYVSQSLSKEGVAVFTADDEKQLDGITATTGCGPAYFFTIVDAVEQALGRSIDRDSALELLAQSATRLITLNPAQYQQLSAHYTNEPLYLLTRQGLDASYRRCREFGGEHLPPIALSPAQPQTPSPVLDDAARTIFTQYMLAQIDAAITYGFTLKQAQQMVVKTALGSAERMKTDTRSLSKQAEAVRSKEGATDRFLKVCEENDALSHCVTNMLPTLNMSPRPL